METKISTVRLTNISKIVIIYDMIEEGPPVYVAIV